MLTLTGTTRSFLLRKSISSSLKAKADTHFCKGEKKSGTQIRFKEILIFWCTSADTGIFRTQVWSSTFIELKSEDCFILNPSPIIVLIPVSYWMADDIVKTYLTLAYGDVDLLVLNFVLVIFPKFSLEVTRQTDIWPSNFCYEKDIRRKMCLLYSTIVPFVVSFIQTDAYLVAGIRIVFLNPLSFYNQLLAPPVL